MDVMTVVAIMEFVSPAPNNDLARGTTENRTVPLMIAGNVSDRGTVKNYAESRRGNHAGGTTSPGTSPTLFR